MKEKLLRTFASINTTNPEKKFIHTNKLSYNFIALIICYVLTRLTRYVRYNVARSRNLCCHGNATLHPLLIRFGVYGVVNNIKVFTVATEM